MRLATYNVEWFNSLFDDDNRLLADGKWSGRHDVTRRDQIAALGIVFHALDADAIMVIEAPDTNRKRCSVAALEHFAAELGLRQRRALSGFANETQQEITLMYDPSVLRAEHDPRGAAVRDSNSDLSPRFDGMFRLDLDVDDRLDRVQFSKPPLEVALSVDGAPPLRLIGAHTKSKAPHGARSKREAIQISIANRRKQLAQCIWLRKRVDEHLAAAEPLVVMGDLNDGPGLDDYEKLFGRSGVEIVMGSNQTGAQRLFDPNAQAALTPRATAAPTTARFFMNTTATFLNALLDYVMISPDLMDTDPKWRIWHPFDDRAIYQITELRDALLTASDHFPVSLDLEWPREP